MELYEYAIRQKCVFSRRLKPVRLSQVLMTVGKLFHRDAAVAANEQSPALVQVRFTSNMLYGMQVSRVLYVSYLKCPI